MKIKLFSDGANITDMYQLYIDGVVKGFTTNPSLLKKAGVRDYESFAKQVVNLIPDLPVSFEVFSDDLSEMEKEARIISSWGKNVYVKIPITNTEGRNTSKIIENLSNDGINLNITAILTLGQVSLANMSLSSNTPSIVSIFAGRISDTGRDAVSIMQLAHVMLEDNKNCELLWASTRELYNIIQAEKCGCDIITVTPDILKKIPMIGKDLRTLSLETVQMFYNDAKEAGYKI